MQPKTLRVRAKGDVLVQDHERLALGVNQFVGRKYQEREDQPGQFGFVPTGEVVELPASAEYVKALKDGDLEPADEATAAVAGIEYHVARARSVPPPFYTSKDGDK